MNFNAYDHLQNPILITTDNGEINYFNHVCSIFFKLPPRKLSNIKKIDELLITDEYKLIDQIKKAQKDQSPIVSPEIKISLNNLTFSVIIKIIPIKEDIIIHLQDFSIERQLHEKYKEQILELKSTHEQILKSDKLTAMGELIAGISHEISSPLTIANDTLLALSDNLQKNDILKAKSDLKDLEDEFIRIKQIVSNMQAMARNKEDSVEIVDLNEIIDESIRYSEELGIISGITVNKVLPKQSLVMANTGKLQQVFLNMLKNSSDALKNIENKEIQFKIKKDSQGIVLEIIDNGIGIEDSDKIFEMFYTTKELGEGTGLGLAISQKIISSFNGTIRLEDSEKGAHFIISLPSLDVESFTRTNRYLLGECELEDPKFVIYSENKKQLNTLFNHFLGKEVILILIDRKEEIQDIFDAYMADKLICCSSSKDCEKIDKNYANLSSLNEVDQIKKIQELIDG